MSAVQRFEGRSLFWPLVLIGVGVIWLLSNLGVLQPASISVLFRLWPLILIIIGLDILFGRRSPALSTVIGLGGVALIIVLMLVGPSLGWASSAEVKQASFTEPVGDAASANVILDLSVGTAEIHALNDSNQLFDADISYVGEVKFEVEGETEKTLTLSQENDTPQTFNFWNFSFVGEQELRWNVGLNPDVPINLTVNSGVSTSTLDLKGLQLLSVDINSGVGTLTLNLPAMEEAYEVNISGGAGTTHITVADGAAVHFDLDGGVGTVNIDLPDDAAVRIDGSSGLGSINLPSNFERVSGGDESGVGAEGLWETPGFDQAERQITINYDGGVGSFNIR